MNPVLKKRLKQLSEQQLCSELFKFLEYYDDFKSSRIPESDMLKFFIYPDSPFWLNLSHLIQRRVDANDLGTDFWSDVKVEVIELIFENLFSLYIDKFALSGSSFSKTDNDTIPEALSGSQLSHFI